MTEETTIYEIGNIKITNLRAVFGVKTYSVSNITSVETKRIEIGASLRFVFFIAGILCLIIGFANIKEGLGYFLFSAVAFGLFYFSNKNSKPSWQVCLTTSSGEVNAHESMDEQLIKKIVEALNNAIVQKG